MEIPQLNQSPVVFNATAHTYKLGEKYLKGVTTTLVRRAYPNTYQRPVGLPEEVWQNILNGAKAKGTAAHQAIELYEDLGIASEIPEVKNYIAIRDDNGFMNLATEYVVSDEEHYASAIDHVWFQEETGEIYLIDIKHTAEVHYPDVTCQLSVYKRFFEKQNPHLKVSGIALLWLRDEKSEFKLLKPMADEVLDALIEADLKDETFDIQQHYGDLPVKFANAEEQIAMLKLEIDEKKKQYEELTSGLFALMSRYGVTKFTGQRIQLTVTKPSKRDGFDMECFKADHKELWEDYKTTVNVKPSLRITLRK